VIRNHLYPFHSYYIVFLCL